MAWWQRIRIISAIALFVSLVAIICSSASKPLAIGLSLIVGICYAATVYANKVEVNQTQKSQTMNLIQLISHYRHDWLNDLQLLFGYVSLKKYDKLNDCLEKIRTKAMQENSIAKLGIPSLVAYFLSHRMKVCVLSLELEMEQDINLAALPLDSAQAARLVQGIVERFYANALPSESAGNLLSVQFALEEEALLFDLDYHGCYRPAELRLGIHALMDAGPKDYTVLEEKYAEDNATVTLQLPFHK